MSRTGGGSLSTQRDRDEAKRKAAKEEVERQQREGGLTIRKMTDEDRKRFPPPAQPRPPRRRYGR